MFKVNDRVRLKHEIWRYPHFIVPAGAEGTITATDDDLFTVKMDTLIVGAEEWDNEVQWVPNNGDDPAGDLESLEAVVLDDDAQVALAEMDVVATAIERGKREIAEDIASGRVPTTVASFSELHDYVDANEYGGLCDDGLADIFAANEYALAHEVQSKLDEWIKNGR